MSRDDRVLSAPELLERLLGQLGGAGYRGKFRDPTDVRRAAVPR